MCLVSGRRCLVISHQKMAPHLNVGLSLKIWPLIIINEGVLSLECGSLVKRRACIIIVVLSCQSGVLSLKMSLSHHKVSVLI